MARTKEFDRQTVLEKAMRVFWSQGYEATSIPDLTAAMGIGRQSLYDTFGDKRALYLAALDRYAATEGASLFAPFTERAPLRTTLHRIFELLIEEAVCDGRRGCFVVNATVERAPCNEAIARWVRANLEGVESLLEEVLRHAQLTGELDPNQDPRALARYLFNAIQGLRVTAKATNDRATLEDIARVTLSAVR